MKINDTIGGKNMTEAEYIDLISKMENQGYMKYIQKVGCMDHLL